MLPGSAAILMLVRKRDPGAAIAELGRYGGKVLRTTLPDEVEGQLRSTLGQPVGAACLPASLWSDEATFKIVHATPTRN